ncbi:hypothetical protein FE257_006053 [Aspergillus nanangensis]|uniref:Uncharacterized protein n=1 Tax=Aspergillus nanangensis TaxID=2582783 RepID=A0AAD4CPM7_ASPNN|nr:hypothetical protein FE257_006053 [Aspergillus nanangensis]
MKLTYLASLCALLATTTSALPAAEEVTARANPEVYGRTCYCGDDCNTVSWMYGINWADGPCFNFYTGLSAAWSDPGVKCKFYNAANCKGSVMSSSNNCANSNVGWLWSASCTTR